MLHCVSIQWAGVAFVLQENKFARRKLQEEWIALRRQSFGARLQLAGVG